MVSPVEVGIVLLVAVLLFGPGRVAGIGKGLGDGLRNFRKGLSGDDEPAVEKQQVARRERAQKLAPSKSARVRPRVAKARPKPA